MILLRLLSAGKTLVGVGRDKEGYRLPEGEGLPRFEGKKNPFRSRACPQSERPQAPARKPASSDVAVAATGSKPAQAQAKAPLFKSAEPADRSKAAAPKRGREFIERMMRTPRNLFKKSANFRPEARMTNTRPAQGELRLETVRVVRNDLSESDIEIVPRPPVPEGQHPGTSGKAESAGSMESAWGRVSARIFGSGNVR